MKKTKNLAHFNILFLFAMGIFMNFGVMHAENGEVDVTQPNINLTQGYFKLFDLNDPTILKVDFFELIEANGQGPLFDELVVDMNNLPTSFDWRDVGIVPAIRDQGSCGSGWAFGTVGIMESAIKKWGGPMMDFSEQFLISCNTNEWSCKGGLTAHKYHFNALGENQVEVGAVLESAKPYTATNGTCTVNYDHSFKLSNWNFITGFEKDIPTVEQIKAAIYKYGPVTARICVGSAFQSYTGGVFSINEDCDGSTNHQIILVGWDDDTQSWILRNSWGTLWGENGYMRIKYNTSRVGEGTSWVIYTTGLIPTPVFPDVTITDTTPTYTWTKIDEATKYQYKLYKDSILVYSKTVSSSVCESTNCSSTPSNILNAGEYQWRVCAYVDGVWRSASAFMNFTLNVLVPNPVFPSGIISDNTPTYIWEKANGATNYQYQLYKDSTLVYSKTVSTNICGTFDCTITPSNVLNAGDYQWRVRANIGGIWKEFSAFKNFTL
ncbi:MAG: C1 family peptidase [Anaerolineaceae bacterium]